MSTALAARTHALKTRDELQAFTDAVTEEFDLTKEDVLQLINHPPKNILEAFLCLEQGVRDKRLSEDDLHRVIQLVGQHFP